MSVYEALQRARRGTIGVTPLRQPAAREIDRPPVSLAPGPLASGPLAPGPLASPLAPLFAAIRPLLDRGRGIVLHIVAATAGEGASTIAREFAMLAGTTGNRRTLLIDADRHAPQTARSFHCATARGLVEGLRGGLEVDDVVRPVAGTLLSVACLVGERGPVSPDAETLRALYGRLRERFELVVVDCPPVGDGTYSALLPEATDGVVLVMQAERTRPAVIAHARDQVQHAGGQVLGAVLNRRTNYIPEFLYKLL